MSVLANGNPRSASRLTDADSRERHAEARQNKRSHSSLNMPSGKLPSIMRSQVVGGPTETAEQKLERFIGRGKSTVAIIRWLQKRCTSIVGGDSFLRMHRLSGSPHLLAKRCKQKFVHAVMLQFFDLFSCEIEDAAVPDTTTKFATVNIQSRLSSLSSSRSQISTKRKILGGKYGVSHAAVYERDMNASAPPVSEALRRVNHICLLDHDDLVRVSSLRLDYDGIAFIVSHAMNGQTNICLVLYTSDQMPEERRERPGWMRSAESAGWVVVSTANIEGSAQQHSPYNELCTDLLTYVTHKGNMRPYANCVVISSRARVADATAAEQRRRSWSMDYLAVGGAASVSLFEVLRAGLRDNIRFTLMMWKSEHNDRLASLARLFTNACRMEYLDEHEHLIVKGGRQPPPPFPGQKIRSFAR